VFSGFFFLPQIFFPLFCLFKYFPDVAPLFPLVFPFLFFEAPLFRFFLTTLARFSCVFRGFLGGISSYPSQMPAFFSEFSPLRIFFAITSFSLFTFPIFCYFSNLRPPLACADLVPLFSRLASPVSSLPISAQDIPLPPRFLSFKLLQRFWPSYLPSITSTSGPSDLPLHFFLDVPSYLSSFPSPYVLPFYLFFFPLSTSYSTLRRGALEFRGPFIVASPSSSHSFQLLPIPRDPFFGFLADLENDRSFNPIPLYLQSRYT